MGKTDYIEEMNKIIDFVEDTPDENDNQWKAVKNESYFVIDLPMTGGKAIEYTITKNFINKIKRYNELYSKVNNYKYALEPDNIVRFYSVVDPVTNNYYIGYSSYPILYSIKTSLSRKLNGGAKTFFDNFVNFEGLKVNVLEYLKNGGGKKEMLDRKKYFEDKFEKGDMQEYTVKDCYDKLFKICKEVVDKHRNELIEFKGVIYRIIDKQSNKQCVESVVFPIQKKELQMHELVDILKENGAIANTMFKDCHDIDINILQNYKGRSKIEMNMMADLYILKDNVKNGSEDNYFVFENDPAICRDMNKLDRFRKKIFALTQFEIFEDTYNDELNYNNVTGFIYMITNNQNNKKFISFSENKTVYETINELYEKALNKKRDINPIGTVLMTVPFKELSIKILKSRTKRSKFNIKIETNKFIEKYNTNHEYNVDFGNFKKRVIISKNYIKR